MKVGGRVHKLRLIQDRWTTTGVRWTKRAAPISVTKCTCRHGSTTVPTFSPVNVNGKEFTSDIWTNVPSTIIASLSRRLHLQPSHPIALTRSLIESCFPKPTYTHYNDLSPIVTVGQNFDSLGFPPDHPGRSRTDTYYINSDIVLRTHTSAHQVDTFREDKSDGYTISADVYRRDAIDRSHYPVFHQMEAARTWDRRKVPGGDIAKAVWADLEKISRHDLTVENPSPTVHAERNPLQPGHTIEEVEAIATHLKRSLEGVVVEIFSRARKATITAGNANVETSETLRVRWVEASFPFTSPSWELEVFWHGDWLEVLGCGVVMQNVLANAGVGNRIGWAFGIGLERIAMLLYSIPDIRLFWSQDNRFLDQFSAAKPISRFVPFSRYPACYKDVAFWLRSSGSNVGEETWNNAQGFHENDVMEVVRSVSGDLVEDVKLVDKFTHPKTGRRSLCYRITYRSLERTLTNEAANKLHENIKGRLVEKLGVELR